jgi:hypothetical protein
LNCQLLHEEGHPKAVAEQLQEFQALQEEFARKRIAYDQRDQHLTRGGTGPTTTGPTDAVPPGAGC